MPMGNVLFELEGAVGLRAATSVPIHLFRAAFSAGTGSYFSICSLTAPVDTNTYFPGCVYIDTTHGRVCWNAAASITAAAIMSSAAS